MSTSASASAFRQNLKTYLGSTAITVALALLLLGWTRTVIAVAQGNLGAGVVAAEIAR